MGGFCKTKDRRKRGGPKGKGMGTREKIVVGVSVIDLRCDRKDGPSSVVREKVRWQDGGKTRR